MAEDKPKPPKPVKPPKYVPIDDIQFVGVEPSSVLASFNGVPVTPEQRIALLAALNNEKVQKALNDVMRRAHEGKD